MENLSFLGVPLGKFSDNFSYSSTKTYVVTPHWRDKMVLTRCHKMCLCSYMYMGNFPKISPVTTSYLKCWSRKVTKSLDSQDI